MWIAPWMMNPALFMPRSEPPVTLPWRSTRIRDDAVISSKNRPKGLSRNSSSVPGTRAEMWVLLRSVQPYRAHSR